MGVVVGKAKNRTEEQSCLWPLPGVGREFFGQIWGDFLSSCPRLTLWKRPKTGGGLLHG